VNEIRTVWPRLEAGQEKRVRLGDLPGYHAAAKHVVVHWWSVGRKSTGPIAVDLKLRAGRP
jgi:hypothetical protein